MSGHTAHRIVTEKYDGHRSVPVVQSIVHFFHHVHFFHRNWEAA